MRNETPYEAYIVACNRYEIELEVLRRLPKHASVNAEVIPQLKRLQKAYSDLNRAEAAMGVRHPEYRPNKAS